jgi:hypothetical protein
MGKRVDEAAALFYLSLAPVVGFALAVGDRHDPDIGFSSA